MGIMDIFRNIAAPVNQQATPGNIPAKQEVSAAVPGTGTVPNNAVVNGTEGATSKSPMDQFTDLFKIDPAANGSNENLVPNFNIDLAKIREVASKSDFSKQIPQELLEKINKGGTEAQAALVSAMNLMSQGVYADSAHVATQIVKGALERQAALFEKQVPSLIKNQNLSDSLRSDNPILNHPAVAPVADLVQQSIRNKFPNSTVEEQRQMANEWMKNFSEAIAPQKKQTQTQQGKETDWNTFLDS